MRLKDRSDEGAWRTFDDLYRPLLVSYARWRGLNDADAEDVAQQCVEVVLAGIVEYEHKASFKSWLRAIAEHKVVDRLRSRRREVQPATGQLDACERPTSGTDRGASGGDEWDRQWKMAHLRHCAERVQHEVSDNTYAAFRAYAIDGREPGAVATAFGMSVNQVYVAKHRVLERIRAIMLELTGEELGMDAA
jgi:RNA polymerase sigma-70 factor (ECF subfamily)